MNIATHNSQRPRYRIDVQDIASFENHRMVVATPARQPSIKMTAPLGFKELFPGRDYHAQEASTAGSLRKGKMSYV